VLTTVVALAGAVAAPRPARAQQPAPARQPSSTPAQPAADSARARKASRAPTLPAATVTTAPIATGAGALTGMSGLSGNSMRLNVIDESRSAQVDAPADTVWAALKRAYADLKLPVTTLVDAERRIGVDNQRFRDRAAGERLVKLVTCTQGMDGRDVAETYEVVLSVVTVATPSDGGGTALTSAVTADARPVFTSGEPVRCVSTGRLEERITAAVRKHTGAP
jgi:hypothetical protein